MGDNSKKSEGSSLQNWYEGVRAEFRKIIWPNKDDLVKEATAVTAVSIALGVIIAIVDSIVKYGINFFIK